MKKTILPFAFIAGITLASSFCLIPEKAEAKAAPVIDSYITLGFRFSNPDGTISVSCQGTGPLICNVSP